MSKEHELEWWQYFLLDVVASVTGVLLVAMVTFFYVTRLLVRFVRQKTQHVMVSHNVIEDEKLLPEKNNNNEKDTE